MLADAGAQQARRIVRHGAKLLLARLIERGASGGLRDRLLRFFLRLAIALKHLVDQAGECALIVLRLAPGLLLLGLLGLIRLLIRRLSLRAALFLLLAGLLLVLTALPGLLVLPLVLTALPRLLILLLILTTLPGLLVLLLVLTALPGLLVLLLVLTILPGLLILLLILTALP